MGVVVPALISTAAATRLSFFTPEGLKVIIGNYNALITNCQR